MKKCPICYEMANLKKMSCNHEICGVCYSKMLIEYKNNICPLCRKPMCNFIELTNKYRYIFNMINGGIICYLIYAFVL